MKSDVLKSEELSSLGKSRTQRGLFDAFLDAARLNGPNTEIVVDGDGRKLSYSDLRRASFALGLPLRRLSKDNDNKALDSFIYKLRIFINNINN